MKIGFDAKRAFFNQSGLGNYSRFIISGLELFGSDHEYTYYTPGKGTVPFSPRGTMGFPRGGYQLTTSYWRSYALASRAEHDGMDLYHGLSHELPQGIEKTSVKSVVTIHDMIPYIHPELYKSVDLAIYKKKWEHACKVADLIIAVSEQTKRDLIKILHVPEENIEVVYQDCHEQFHTPITREDFERVQSKYGLPKDYLLSVGTIEKRKNQKYLLEALLEMPETMHCVLVGKPKPYHKELVRFVEENQLSSRVHFIEGADFADFPALYWGAKVFVYPSLYEGFGIPLLEAMNAGVPVITSKGGVFEEVGGQAALYVNLKDPSDLARQVHDLLTDPAAYAHRVRMGEDRAKKFRAEEVIPQLLKLYEQTIAG